MSLDLLCATSTSNSAFRVVCGEMVVDDKQKIHNEAVFGILKNGSLSISVGDECYELHKDDIYFVSPNQKYEFKDAKGAEIEVVSLNFSNPTAVSQDYIPQTIIRALVNGNCSPFAKITPDDSSHESMTNALEEVRRAEKEKSDYFQLQVYSKMYGLFFELFSNHHISVIDVKTRSKKYRALLRVTHYIDEHYCDGVSLEEVAEATGISRYYVSHLFKELMDNTFVGYVNELRLNHAAMLLVTTDSPIIEIASKSGFNNLSNFNRAFKMHFGKTPSTYRKV